ncbi:hypothetical protein AB1L30_04440 [Bremerella sp. JC817]|uniref:hypothetical protein n=1 Tax=Bremerella sp. JC817 TaxID=3231756 RepID=UPI0034583EA2
MQTHRLEDMKGGWIVGDFNPTILPTKELEVAIKTYAAGDKEPKHHHKIAEEITVIASGKVVMCDQVIEAGTIVQLEPGESTAFEALEPTITVVVKRPSVPGDKYLD